MHAEATSEKIAMGWYLDGRVSAVVGTHTHVPTADAEILPKGTGYQTDAGMTGPYESVIGMAAEDSLKRLLTGMPTILNVAKGSPAWRDSTPNSTTRRGGARTSRASFSEWSSPGERGAARRIPAGRTAA